MTVYEALEILGINDSYDEKELKRVRRELAKKYHPDNFNDDNERRKAEEKLKQINIAYETLLNNKNRNANFNYTYHNYYQENRTAVFNQKISKRALLIKYRAKKYKITLSKWASYINEIILEFTVEAYNTVDEVNSSYQEALKRIVNLYKELQREFFEKHIINESVISETINYSCSLDDFYEQLLKIKNKYSIGNVFLRKIEEVTEKYKYYAGYDIARAEIEVQKRKKYNERVGFLQKNIDIFTIEGLYKLMQTFLKQLEDEIKEIFSKAFDIKNKIDNLESTVYETNDTEIINAYMTLKINFENGQLFKASLNQIEYVKSMIRRKKVLSSVNIKTVSDSSYYVLSDVQKIKLNNNKLDYLNLKDNIIDDKYIDKINGFMKVKRQNFNEDK